MGCIPFTRAIYFSKRPPMATAQKNSTQDCNPRVTPSWMRPWTCSRCSRHSELCQGSDRHVGACCSFFSCFFHVVLFFLGFSFFFCYSSFFSFLWGGGAKNRHHEENPSFWGVLLFQETLKLCNSQTLGGGSLKNWEPPLKCLFLSVPL